jgi:hypothetical protein
MCPASSNGPRNVLAFFLPSAQRPHQLYNLVLSSLLNVIYAYIAHPDVVVEEEVEQLE